MCGAGTILLEAADRLNRAPGAAAISRSSIPRFRSALWQRIGCKE
jgi:23S rRNA G2445 N2-methylase RlmL